MTATVTFPRRAAPKILPTRMRRKDAEDIADEVTVETKLSGPQALFILPTGEYRIAVVGSTRYDDWCWRYPQSLCGTYDINSQRSQLVEDICLMGRET